MTRVKLLAAAFLCLTAGLVGAQPAPTDTVAEIRTRLSGLRDLSDADRVGATKNLALRIRSLPAGKEKVSLAYSLANLSTEGDFGRDTLQEVTDTLALAVKEAPVAGKDGKPAGPYMSLAQLSRYEHMKVPLESPDFNAALAELDAIDARRSKADFTLTDLSGKSWRLSDLKGKVVLVNFWATWCPPCRKEMPDLEALSVRFKDQGLVILSISDEDLQTVQPFIAEHKYTYPILLDTDKSVHKAYEIEGIPKSFLYNREGKMVAQTIDMRTMGQFLELLKVAGIQ